MKRFICLCFFIAIGLIFAASSNALDSGNAAGIWLLDENSGITAGDVSGNGNSGEILNAEWVDGVFGSALSFNGSDAWVIIPDADSLDLQEAWTITAWVFVNGSESDYGHILGKREATTNYCFRTSADASGWEAYFNRDGWQGLWGIGSVIKDEWLYMTAVYDGAAMMTIYENAVEIGTGDVGGPPPAGTSEVNIGGWTGGGELIDGLLDDIGLFSVALSVEDIENLMNDGIASTIGVTAVAPSGKLASTWGSVRADHR